MKPEVIIYTDGACSGNPGPGGWGAILRFGEHLKELTGSEARTTNNRMELTAVIRSLQALKFPCRVKLHSDSAYVINAFQQGWIDGWMARNWKKADRSPVENRDLWEELLVAMDNHDIEWIKVKGHSNDTWNNRADKLATGAIRKAG